MADTSSQDQEKAREKELKAEQERLQNEEKAKEQAAEKARKEEQERQKEREKAAEQGRKEGKEAERARGRRGSGIWIVIALVVLAIIIAAIAWVMVSVTVTDVTPGIPLPFTTNYAVSFPEGQTISLGGSRMNVLYFENELITDIDGAKQKLVVGEERSIPERRAMLTAFGFPLFDTNYVINLTYKGERDNRAYFDMAVYTSKQVPDMILRRLFPPEIDARLV
jgi:hypothetical protein